MSDQGPGSPRDSGPSFFRRRRVVVASVVLGSFLLSILPAAWFIQRFITFPLPRHSDAQPRARTDNGGEQVWLDADGVRVEAWYLPPAKPQLGAPIVIYSHGNAELIDMRAGEFGTLRAAGVGVLQVEYPGYGRSEGSPSETSLTAALVAGYDWAVRDPRIDPQRIVGYGRSLGGGAIAQLAARRKLAALALESTFESLGDVIEGYGLPRWMLINHFDSGAVLRRYAGPVLLLHGTLDRVFPSDNAQRLAKASGHAEVRLDACGHNDCPPHWELVLSFLARNGVCKAPDPETHHENISDC